MPWIERLKWYWISHLDMSEERKLIWICPRKKINLDMSEERELIWICPKKKKSSGYDDGQIRWIDTWDAGGLMFTSQSQQSRSLVPSTFSKYLLSIEMQESLSFPDEWCHLTSLTACTSFGAKTIFRAQLATTCKRNLKARKSSKLVLNNKKSKNV